MSKVLTFCLDDQELSHKTWEHENVEYSTPYYPCKDYQICDLTAELSESLVIEHTFP
jgi:hypothetical protein